MPSFRDLGETGSWNNVHDELNSGAGSLQLGWRLFGFAVDHVLVEVVADAIEKRLGEPAGGAEVVTPADVEVAKKELLAIVQPLCPLMACRCDASSCWVRAARQDQQLGGGGRPALRDEAEGIRLHGRRYRPPYLRGPVARAHEGGERQYPSSGPAEIKRIKAARAIANASIDRETGKDAQIAKAIEPGRRRFILFDCEVAVAVLLCGGCSSKRRGHVGQEVGGRRRDQREAQAYHGAAHREADAGELGASAHLRLAP